MAFNWLWRKRGLPAPLWFGFDSVMELVGSVIALVDIMKEKAKAE